MSKTAVIFMHEANEGSGSFGDVLKESGFGQMIIHTPQQNLDGFDAFDPDLLMVMGGPMGVYEADRYPYLAREIEILERRLKADKPTLGVCLGAQLMAKALGANVYKGKAGYEYGWSSLTLTSQARHHPAQHLSPEKTSMFHDHGDTFDLPQGATLLASSARYQNQIFAHGQKALALQCHPEVTESQLTDWPIYVTPHLKPAAKAEAIATIKADHVKNVGHLKTQSALFLKSWLSTVGLL